MSDQLQSTVAIIFSLTAICLSIIAVVVVLIINNKTKQTLREIKLMAKRNYNQRQRDYVKAVSAGEMGTPLDN